MPDPIPTDDPRACRWCGDPLPAREPGRRGRPSITHEGDCRRLHTNRTNLAYRIGRYFEAQRLQVDPSDDVPGMIPGDLVGLDGGEEGESLRSRLERGGFGAVEDLEHTLHGDLLMAAVERWEEQERTWKALLRAEEALSREDAPREPVRMPDGRAVEDLDGEERAALDDRIRARVRERLERARFNPSDPS